MSSPKTEAPRPRRVALHLETLAVLDRTHRAVLAMLERLQSLVDRLVDPGAGDGQELRTLAHEICRFFDETARPHHAAEERLVFPDLLARGDAELVQHVRRLQQDHGWLDEDWLELAPHLRAVANGQSWYDVDLLREAVPVFAELCRDHIALEETVVYPASLAGLADAAPAP